MQHARVEVSDIEVRLGTRYTAQTLRALRQRYPGVRFVWLMGADNLAQFHRWQDWRQIIDSVPMLLRAYNDGAMDVVNIKISKFGGLTRAKLVRDLCVELGIAMTIEDTWGGDFTTAAIAHLAHSTPPELLFTSTDFNSYVTVSTAQDAPQRRNGRMSAPTEPGLGIRPRMEVLGDPVLDIFE